MDQWSLLFWRGLIIAAGLTGLTLLSYGSKSPGQFRRIGRPGILIACLFTCSTISFVTALYYTSVANTLIILSASSMFAALYSRVFLRESIAVRTWVTMIVVVAAIGLIVSNSFGSGSGVGDCFAISASMCMAGAFTVTRQAKACNMIPATALSGLLTAIIAFFPAQFEPMASRSLLLMFLLAIVLITAFALLTVGPRYITAPEVSLLMPLETVLGPLFIWLVIGERPANVALIGGSIVIVALTLHSFLSLHAQARVMD